MATIEELLTALKTFDKDYGIDWSNVQADELLDALQYGIVALAGEVGECANIVKKMMRDKIKTGTYDTAMIEPIKEELIDVFIYVLKAAILLQIDIEKEYFRKMEINKKRFAKYKV